MKEGIFRLDYEEATYQQARRFLDAAQLITGTIHSNIPHNPIILHLSIPIAVLFSFACELYMKCILYIECGKKSYKHDLISIFNLLAPQTRVYFRNEVALKGNILNGSFDDDFRSISELFLRWRYANEGLVPTHYTNIVLLEEISKLCNGLALGKNPQWQQNYLSWGNAEQI